MAVVIVHSIVPSWQTEWGLDGASARMKRFTRINGGEIVSADCGGKCGWCLPENGNIFLDISQDRGTVGWRHGVVSALLGPVLLTLLRHVARILANGRAAFSHWLKFLRRVAKTLVIQGPGHLGWESGGFPSQRVSNVAIWCLVCC